MAHRASVDMIELGRKANKRKLDAFEDNRKFEIADLQRKKGLERHEELYKATVRQHRADALKSRPRVDGGKFAPSATGSGEFRIFIP